MCRPPRIARRGEDFNISNNIYKLNHVREKIRTNLNLAHERACKTYNLRTRPISFQIGQIVFRKNHILSNMSKKINRKFMPKYIKCKIMNKIGNNLYDIVDI